MKFFTKSGKFVVYHKKDAGQPDLHKGGPWFFEPLNYESNEIFSEGYSSARAALQAAELWEANECD